jgi:Zn-finger nucleic acid-binding protein
MIFQGAKFCSHCGASVTRKELPDDSPAPCPRCKVNMEVVTLGKNTVRDCPKCEGLWVDAVSLNQIYADREEQAAVLGTVTLEIADPNRAFEAVRYVPCPACGQLMHRVNFAHCSGVVVDVCKAHGTWFDKDELRRIVEFIRAGGLDRSRRMEIEELERKRRTLESDRATAQISNTVNADYGSGWTCGRYDGWDMAVSAAAAVLRHFIR